MPTVWDPSLTKLTLNPCWYGLNSTVNEKFAPGLDCCFYHVCFVAVVKSVVEHRVAEFYPTLVPLLNDALLRIDGVDKSIAFFWDCKDRQKCQSELA